MGNIIFAIRQYIVRKVAEDVVTNVAKDSQLDSNDRAVIDEVIADKLKLGSAGPAPEAAE